MSEKIVHRAKHIREDGAVSPLCAKTPRAINLKRATWTNRDEAVTCKNCKELINAVKIRKLSEDSEQEHTQTEKGG